MKLVYKYKVWKQWRVNLELWQMLPHNHHVIIVNQPRFIWNLIYDGEFSHNSQPKLSEYQWFWCLGTIVSLKANRLTLKRYISFISIASVTNQGPENIITHYCDVIMGAITSQITSRTIVYSTFYSDADQGKHQSSASLAFVRRIHRWPVISPHKGPVTRKMLPFDDVIMFEQHNSEP